MGSRMSSGMRWTLGAGVGLVFVVLLAAVLVPFVVPVATFIPQITRIASEKLNQPVSIAGLEVQLLPTPRAVASGIRVGKGDLVQVGELEIIPDVMSFVGSGPRTIRLIRAEGVEVKEAALAIPGTLPKSEPGEPLNLHKVVMKQVKVHHSAAKVPEFDLEADLAPGLQVQEARLETRDKALKVTAQPQKDGAISLALVAKNWSLPAGPPLLFENLSVDGRFKGSTLDLQKVAGRLYGGSIGANVRADWTKLWQVAGKVAVDGVDVVPLQQALGKPAKLSGRLKANATFSSRARTPELLGKALSLDSPFEVVGGAYHGVDLSKVGVTSTSTEGATPFEEFKGSLQLRAQQVKISDLCVRSPKLVAGGNVDIAPDEKLSGKLDISMAKTGGFVGMPVSLSGTTSDPSVRPTKGYVIGAVLGTVLLPGIGTSLGASAGSRLEGTSSCK